MSPLAGPSSSKVSDEIVWEAPLPPLGPYESKELAVEALKEFSIDKLFAVTTRRTYGNGQYKHVHIQCFRGRLYEQHALSQPENRKRQRTTAGTGCPFDVRIHPSKTGKPYHLEIRNNGHNHGPLESKSAHIDGRRLTEEQKQIVLELTDSGASVTAIIKKLTDRGDLAVEPLRRDVHNLRWERLRGHDSQRRSKKAASPPPPMVGSSRAADQSDRRGKEKKPSNPSSAQSGSIRKPDVQNNIFVPGFSALANRAGAAAARAVAAVQGDDNAITRAFVSTAAIIDAELQGTKGHTS